VVKALPIVNGDDVTEDDRPDPEYRTDQAWDWLPVVSGDHGNDRRAHRPVPAAAERIRGNRPSRF
jgi:hypothetical protein